MSEPEQIGVEVPVLWVGGESLETIKVNQFVVQVDNAGDIFMTFGTLTPPLLIGDTKEAVRKQAEAISHVPIRSVGKYSLSARSLREFIGVLQNGLQMVERQEEAAK